VVPGDCKKVLPSTLSTGSAFGADITLEHFCARARRICQGAPERSTREEPRRLLAQLLVVRELVVGAIEIDLVQVFLGDGGLAGGPNLSSSAGLCITLYTQHRTRNVRDAQGQAPDDSARQSRGPDVIKSQSKVEQLSSGTLGSSYVVTQVPLHYQNLNLRDRGRNFSTTSGDSRTYEPCWRLTHEEGAFRQSPDISCYSPVANTEDRRTSDNQCGWSSPQFQRALLYTCSSVMHVRLRFVL
jgi:hypothetical protein